MAQYQYGFSQKPQIINNRYKILRLLSTGGKCNIKIALDQQNNIQVVLKELKNHNSVLRKYSDRETDFTKRCLELSKDESYNPHILRYYDVFIESSSIYIVMELCNDDLEKKLQKEGFHSKQQTDEYLCKVLQIFKQVLLGYEYLLHRFGPQFMHRDIKPQNILYNEKDGLYKLCDFECSKISDFDYPTGNIGTQYFMAPEIQQISYQSNYDNKCDIYSMGVLLYWLIIGNAKEINLDNVTNVNLRYILEAMLQPTPQKRIGWNYLLKHEIFLLTPEDFLSSGIMPQIISFSQYSKILPKKNNIAEQQFELSQDTLLLNVNTSFVAKNNNAEYLVINTLFSTAFKKVPEQNTRIQRCLFALWIKIYDKFILKEKDPEIKEEIKKCKEIITMQQLQRIKGENNVDIEFYTIGELKEQLLQQLDIWKDDIKFQQELKNILNLQKL